MTSERNGFAAGAMAENLESLAGNTYPGNGIILGVSIDGERAVQVYWVTDRRKSAHATVLTGDEMGKVELETPGLDQPECVMMTTNMIETNPYPRYKAHLVANGEQLSSVAEELHYAAGCPMPRLRFMDAVVLKAYKPDGPNFAPPITGAFFVPTRTSDRKSTYDYSITKRNPTTGEPEHTFGGGNLDDIPNGAGICFHTYSGEGSTLPSFEGNPFAVPLESSAQATAESLWGSLNPDNKVALVVKTIDKATGKIGHHIISALQETAAKATS